MKTDVKTANKLVYRIVVGVLALGCMIVPSMAQRADGLARDGVGQEVNQVKDQLRNAESGISAPKVPTLAPDAIQQLKDEAEAELEEGLDEAAETSEDLSDAVAEDSAVEEATTAVEAAVEGETPVVEDSATTTEEEAEPDAEIAADDATDTSDEVKPGEGEEE